jgi:hypothetical protein
MAAIFVVSIYRAAMWCSSWEFFLCCATDTFRVGTSQLIFLTAPHVISTLDIDRELGFALFILYFSIL